MLVVDGLVLGAPSEVPVGKQPFTAVCRRLQLKCDGTRRRTGGGN